MILIANPVSSTVIVALFLITFAVLSSRPKKYSALFPTQLSNELKGFAILAIVFSHIGYLLASTDQFLWPLSILAGVGVNLFLFLSGYGLTMSAIRKPPTIQSNAKRLLKLYIPLWIILILFFFLSCFINGATYSPGYIAKSFAGLFIRADANLDINSVLWYFSLILFYYFLFPLLFNRRHIWLSALGLIAIGIVIVFRDPVVLHDVMRLYQVHILAFPIGILVAWAVTNSSGKRMYQKVEEMCTTHNVLTSKKSRVIAHIGVMTFLCVLFGYSAVHSYVDQQPLLEQLSSLLTMFLLIAIFIIKRFEVGLFAVFGYVSFEIYLLHWPLVSRYDVLYIHMPAWTATVLYLAIFLLLGKLLQLTGDKAKHLLDKLFM